MSVSRKGVFEECPQKYKYKYDLKIPSPAEEPFYFVFGKIIHTIAQVYVENRGVLGFDEVANKVLNGEIEIEEGVKAPQNFPAAYKTRLIPTLRALKKINEKVGTIGEVEYEFKYDLDPPNQKYVVGFIDRLIIKEDKCFIIDYKTTQRGKWRKDRNSVLQDLQLRCYARIVQKTFNIEPKNIKAALYYFEGEELLAVNFSEQSLELAEKELLNTYNKIVNTDSDKVMGNVGEHCFRCDYKNICPFYNIGRGI